MDLYAVSFVQGDMVRVVILHAESEEDALYCIREGYGRVREEKAQRITIEVGVMQCVYEAKVTSGLRG